MPWFHEVLTSIFRSHARSRRRFAVRVMAATLNAVLVFGSIAPGVAFAGEADSEQEGTAPPGALPGLEEGAELEPGEETPLEELPGAVGGGEATEEGLPLETEPTQEPQPPPEEPAVQAQPPATSEEPTSAPAPGPEYETATEPPAPAPVENQALAAPESAAPAQSAQSTPKAAEPAAEAPAPASPPEEAPPPEAPGPPPAVPAQGDPSPGSLAGHRVHVVRAGECLWSIAEALLPAGAGTAEIAAEVQRLWQLNASRIGTGDPSLVYAGTEFRLH